MFRCTNFKSRLDDPCPPTQNLCFNTMLNNYLFKKFKVIKNNKFNFLINILAF
jgi:hypothetical protein